LFITSGPSAHAFPFTPSETAVFAKLTRAIYVGGTGDRVDVGIVREKPCQPEAPFQPPVEVAK
jgi:hypothetical protein